MSTFSYSRIFDTLSAADCNCHPGEFRKHL